MDSRLQQRKYDIQVHDAQLAQLSPSDDSVITADCLVFVYDAGTKTLSTIKGDEVGTALANPITRAQFATDDKIKFWSGSTSHDIVVCHADGSRGSYVGVTPNVHRVTLDRSGADKAIVIPFVFNDNVETDTGVDLPVNFLVREARVEVVTTDATETINVGLLASESGGDADGFLAAVSLANAGFVQNVAYTVGSNETYLSANTYGALIAPGSLGNDVATDVGSAFFRGHVTTAATARSVSYTCSAGSDTAAGYIHIIGTLLR